jgi:hypothetical protein
MSNQLRSSISLGGLVSRRKFVTRSTTGYGWRILALCGLPGERNLAVLTVSGELVPPLPQGDSGGIVVPGTGVLHWNTPILASFEGEPPQ